MGATSQSIDTTLITEVVAEVLQRLNQGDGVVAAPTATASPAGGERLGVFDSVDAAVGAARRAQQALKKAGLAGRSRAVEAIRRVCREDAEELGRREFEET